MSLEFPTADDRGSKNNNAPTGVGAQFNTMISILYANGFVKQNTKIFARLFKWFPFNFLRVAAKLNSRHLLITRTLSYTKKAQITSDGPLPEWHYVTWVG